MMNKSRNVLMILLILLFTFAAACGDDDEKSNNGNNANNVNNSQDQDAGNNGEDDASDEEDVEEQDTTPPPPTCEPLSPAIGDGVCDSLCQTGCAAGQACVTGQSTTGVFNQCQPEGTGVQGDDCSQDGCQAGYTCAQLPDETTPKCMKYCRPGSAESQCDPGTACNVGVVAGEQRIAVCSPERTDECTIYPNAGCGEGEQCYPTDANATKTQCGAFNADAVAGNSCEMLNDCNENQLCVGDNTCQDLCLTPGEACGEGKTCQGLQGVTFGVCIGN